MIIYLISPFQNYGIIFYKAEADFWCADVAQVGFRLVSVRNGFTNFKLLTLVELLYSILGRLTRLSKEF